MRGEVGMGTNRRDSFTYVPYAVQSVWIGLRSLLSLFGVRWRLQRN